MRTASGVLRSSGDSAYRAIAEIDPVNSRRVGYREDNHLDVSLFGRAVVPNQPF
jgi:hypothetical protein